MRFPIPIACSLLVSLLACPAAAQAPMAPPQPQEVRIAIERADLTLQGKKLSLPCDLSEITRLLGPGDRVSKLRNWITTWDKLGIIVYCSPETTRVISVAVDFSKKEYKFSPQSVFSGKLTLDGAEVGPTSALGPINAAKNGEKLAEHIQGLPWSISYPQHLVTVGVEKDASGAETGIDQVAVSLKEPKKSPPAKK